MANETKYCAKCKRAVRPSKDLICSNKLWRGACTACKDCDIPLNSNTAESENEQILYCPTHSGAVNYRGPPLLPKNTKARPVTTVETYPKQIQDPLPIIDKDTEPANESIRNSVLLDTKLVTQSIEEVIGNSVPESWSIEQVILWLSFVGLEELTETFRKNEINGSLLMSDGLDDAILKDLISELKHRIRFKSERTKLKSKQQESKTLATDNGSNDVTEKSINPSETVLLSPHNKDPSLTTSATEMRNTKSHDSLPTARIDAETTYPIPKENRSSSNNQMDLKYLLQDMNCIHSIPMDTDYFNTDDHEFLTKCSLCLCSAEDITKSAELDQTFNTLVDETINAKTLIEELVQNHSLKAYVVDSLKRYHSLMDIIHILPSCVELQSKDFQQKHRTMIENFLDIANTITKSVLLTTTIDSMSYESQRYFGNFIKKNDLSIPFAYYAWNKQRNLAEYKINFNTLTEIMCLTTGRYVLQIGSESAMGMGKTSLLQFIFPDKRLETFRTDGSSALRNGCIDVFFSSDTKDQKNESYVIFDVHGTLHTFNKDIITSIQEYCSFQILCVTEKDLNSAFLSSMMNCSKFIQKKPTIVIIFDQNYDDRCYQAEKVIDPFRLKYQDWECVKWITAPPENLWNQRDSHRQNKDLARSQRLIKSFSGMTGSLNEEIQRQIHCTSIFSIQFYYLNVKTSKNSHESVNYSFQIQNDLDTLFGNLNEKTENLRIATPVTYLDSEIKQCEKELLENWNAPQMKIQTKKHDLIQQRTKVATINSYTTFFIDLLKNRSYIELLITEKYLERWRSQFEATLLEQSTKAKNEALKFSSQIKQLEERLSVDKNFSQIEKDKVEQQLLDIKSNFNKQRALITKIDNKLMNIDLTIGLFIDEIMALYHLSPLLFDSKSLIQDIAKTISNLMLKGFAIHILRGRPLRCHSKLIEESIKFIQTTQQPPLILTVIGEQSSAKSSLMNTTFGCNFRVSSGRCTIGMYMSVIHWRSETIVIFDTEGLLSLEEAGSIFDNQMVTMAVLSSHLILINHKGEISSNLKDLIGMSFYAKLNIRSSIKPKLLFVLRDQTDLTANTTFCRQLTQLKEQLHVDSQFLKSSIDDELEINSENVYLLPNAFSHEINPVSSVTQRWRNQLFPKQICELRNIIFNNITSTTKPQNFPFFKNTFTNIKTQTVSCPETPNIDPAYTDMAHLYKKISSNWEAIDRLGPKLLQCKTLYELSIMEELQTIANDIIQEKNVTVYRDGENLINQTLLTFSRNNCIDMNRDYIVEQFNRQLNIRIESAVGEAQRSFNDKTERSSYVLEIKLKVSKSIEPPIRSAQHLLKDDFEERLNDLLKKARLNNAQKQLLDSVQKEFDQNKSLQSEDLNDRIETLFEYAMEQHRKDLRSSCETENIIIEKILKFYNEQLSCKQGLKIGENIYNLLPLITDMAQHKKYFQKFESCLLPLRRQDEDQGAVKTENLWQSFKSLFISKADRYISKADRYISKADKYISISDKYIDSLWTQLKVTLLWFTNQTNGSENKNLFAEIWNVVIKKFEEDLLILITNTKLFSSNPKTLQQLFQHIENAMDSSCIKNNSARLVRHELCLDLVVIGLDIIINQAIEIEKLNYESNLQKSKNEMTKCKDNLSKQCTDMKDSFELGKTLAAIIGKQLFDEISALLLRRIEKDIREDIVRSQFINHDDIQKRAYDESFTEANGENIIKYVYDINRYFIELSLREIKTTSHVVIHKHLLNFQDLFILVINKANDRVQQRTYRDTWELRDDVRNEILQLADLNLNESVDTQILKISLFANIIRLPINEANKFKQGFKNIENFYKDIENRVADLTKNMKAKVLNSCKQSVAQKLGCQVRCPGCGAKCSKPEPHDEEDVEVWQYPCKNCPTDKCICEHPKPKSVVTHETTYHIAGAFYGVRYHKLNTPCLELCYQRWNTGDKYIWKKSDNNAPKTEDDDDNYELISPSAKYYNEYHPAWYNNLKQQSTEGNACRESIPPPDQSRAWMVVRYTLLNRYKNFLMVDAKEYDKKLYPPNVETLPANFEPKWKDEIFE